ncbi:rab11 family-interacting protein 1 isoform X2 [Diorhabda sublineata]|uniref:rab11 family-interacting protein 1 isoform X2 n=1 Tax=Diorhabda sublineata TaxID=1163346 RepID=UPI0024E13AFC|nr:rab11 family-interacting protein 1 isoform X2 [Diorhabda sublineata]
MWMPTHVQVTVQRAEKILLKGKNNTNDCFVTIALGKTKYQTSVKEKSGQQVEWHEECELPIPDQGNTAEIILTVLHHNYLGIDEFLGRVNIPLNTLDIYERPKNKWFELQSKPGKNSKKERGQLEVKIGFTVKSGSLTNLSKKEKHKSSLSHVAQSVGGSLMSLGSAEKRKGIKKFAKSIGSKMNLKGKKKDYSDGSSIGSVGSLTIQSENEKFHSKQSFDDADPGVVSDEDDFMLDDLSHKSSASSLNHPISIKTASPILKNSSIENISHTEKKSASASIPPIKPPRIDQKPPQDEWESKLIGNKPRDKHELLSDHETPINNSSERIIIGGETEIKVPAQNYRISNELLQKYEGKSRKDLILSLVETKNDLEKQKKKLKDLEDYLDDLLLRVMETTPCILQNPYVTCKMAAKHTKMTS